MKQTTNVAPQPVQKPPAIEDILARQNYVSEEDIKKAKTYAARNNTSVVDYLISQELISHQLLGQALAESYGVPFADLSKNAPSAKQLLKLPEHFARQFMLVIYKEDDKEVAVATSEPANPSLSAFLTQQFPNKKIKVFYSQKEAIEDLFAAYRKPLDEQFQQIIQQGTKIAPAMLTAIFTEALTLHASDIHFEPREDKVIIRFRVDGILQQVGTLEYEIYENILNRIKVQGHLRIDEHFVPQDGAMRVEAQNTVIDMRISLVPTLSGEKVTLRILSAYVRSFTLNDLGLNEVHQELLMKNARKPFGMILVTGPTGSGKTTTLYGLLKLLNKPEVNITTIEDPVEYRIAGVNQIQVNQATNLTFAQGLRSIVRQDPNIILVGEIRDQETAEIAVNAALTGHLLVSTFHANDAATAIPRLLEIGVEPFLLASTLELVIAQRLVRKICESCRFSQAVTMAVLKKNFPAVAKYFSGKSFTLYKGKGCEICNFTGYKGRVAIYEYVDISPAMEDLMLRHPSAQEIWALAHKEGAQRMFDDGIAKVKNGITTIQEVLRVASPEEEKIKKK